MKENCYHAKVGSKYGILFLSVAILLVITVSCLSGCVKTDGKYFDIISKYSFWDNKGSEAIAQYKYYDIMDSFLSDNTTIKDGKVVDNRSGKIKKVMFLGWDGTRADAISNIFYDKNNFDTNGYNYEVQEYSGLHKMKQSGGVYMAYAGGEKGKDSEQEASTCAGFTSILTGGWHTKHGVDLNSDVKKAEVDTIMMKYAKLGLNTGFAFDWGQFFDVTLQKEVEYILEHPEISKYITYRDIDRTFAKSLEEAMKIEEITNKKYFYAQSLELFNAVAVAEKPEQPQSDISMRDYLLGRIEADDDVVAGVFHRPDTNGHTTGFTNQNPNYVNSVRNANVYLYQMLQVIEEREKNLNEDWLVIVCADHGGNENGHGYQILENRNVWVACNKPIDSKYYGKNYNGFVEKG